MKLSRKLFVIIILVGTITGSITLVAQTKAEGGRLSSIIFSISAKLSVT